LDGTNNEVLAGGDAQTADENGIASFAIADLLANDTDFDGDTLSISSVSGTSSKGAAVAIDGLNITYDPGTLFDALDDGETTTDTFTYDVTDGNGSTVTATVTVTISGANDAAVITSAAEASVAENTTEVLTVTATDVDSADLVTFSISGGADGALFTIDAISGALSFLTAPDFEAPTDEDGDNGYEVEVAAFDGTVETKQLINVAVTDVAEGIGGGDREVIAFDM
ncbi:MAG: Ig-like domain-containing protein, partial [Pseudomonadota bacterium]